MATSSKNRASGESKQGRDESGRFEGKGQNTGSTGRSQGGSGGMTGTTGGSSGRGNRRGEEEE